MTGILKSTPADRAAAFGESWDGNGWKPTNHAAEAVALLRDAGHQQNPQLVMAMLTEAQVHATLALTQAIKEQQ